MADSKLKRTRSQASGASNPPKRRKPASYPMPKRRKTTPKKNLPFIPAPLPPAAEGLQHAVFDTTELLENILVHLPVEDIYKVREVNKYWKEVVNTSPSILCKLFVNVQEPTRIWTKNFSDEKDKFTLAPAPAAGRGKPTTKLSLVEGFEIREKMGLVGHEPDSQGKLNLQPVRLNPFLGVMNCHIASQRSWASHERMTGDWVEEVEVSFNEADRQRWRDWIGMEDSLFMSAQITDPPTRRVTFSQRVRGCVSCDDDDDGCAVEARVDLDFECEEKFWRRGGGVMMKDVFRLLGLGLGVGRVIEGNETITSNEITRLGPVVRFAKMKGHDLRDEVQYVMRLHSSVVPSEEEWADMGKEEVGTAE